MNLKLQKQETKSRKILLDVIFSRFLENEVWDGRNIA